MKYEQVIVGGITAFLCLLGLINEHWFLTQTRKGQKLLAKLGEQRAKSVLRGFLIAGIVFGTLLATDIIHPVRW